MQQTIFDVRRPGAEEIVEAVGLIGHGIDYDKWRPLVHFGLSEVKARAGRQIVDRLCSVYMASKEPTETESELIALLQQATAMFTWLRVIPTLDAQHDEAGRGKRLGENEKGLTALQEYKDEENIRRMALEATDALLRKLDEDGYPYWLTTDAYQRRMQCLFRSKKEFDAYYRLDSHLVFEMILPIMEEVQYTSIMSTVGSDRLKVLLDRAPAGDGSLTLLPHALRACALLTMAKAFRRLSAELLPGGATQLQMTQPVASRLRAEREAREAAAAELEESGRQELRLLADLVAALDAQSVPVDIFGKKHISHSKGFSF